MNHTNIHLLLSLSLPVMHLLLCYYNLLTFCLVASSQRQNQAANSSKMHDQFSAYQQYRYHLRDWYNEQTVTRDAYILSSERYPDLATGAIHGHDLHITIAIKCLVRQEWSDKSGRCSLPCRPRLWNTLLENELSDLWLDLFCGTAVVAWISTTCLF